MTSMFRRTLPAVIALGSLATGAQAQYFKTHGASISVGGTGQFERILTENPSPQPFTYSIPNGTGSTTISNQQQYTTWSAGFVSSLQFHPVAWAGVALNYGFSHYQERYVYNFANFATPGRTNVTTDMHEFTGGYLFHPKHIPFQPYVEIGGGALDFAPSSASNQIRGAGLLETGFDLPIHSEHIGFRVSGRSLYYRQPNFYNSAISTRGWRVTMEPAVSAFYRF